jgi:hypothetical protein
MKIRDLTKFQDEEGNVNLPQKIQAIFQHGFKWRQERENQELFIEAIDDILNEKARLFRSARLSARRDPIPIILLTPSSINVINPKRMEGVFQARDTGWMEMDHKGNLSPAKSNPVRETLVHTKLLESYLHAHGYEDLPVEGVLAFLSAGVHVDTKHPAVRILHSDAVRNFARQIAMGEPQINLKERDHITELIVEPRPPARDRQEQAEAQTPPSSPTSEPSRVEQGLQGLAQTFDFSRRQWILLGSMVLVEILILITFIFLVISTT